MNTSSVISLPQGVRDILPDEAEKIGSVESGIVAVFAKRGFQRVITPLLEYVDTLSIGMGEGLKERVLKFIDPSTGRVIAIRPDITAQIARLAATRLKEMPLPLKLCYNENVLRLSEPRDRDGKSREVLQLGAEFISAKASPSADAEMISMAIESLLAIKLKSFKIDIGDVGFLKSVLETLKLADQERRAVKEAIAIKDRSGLEAVLADCAAPIAEGDRALLISLTTLYGEEEVIEKAAGYTTNPAAHERLDNLRAVVDIITQNGHGAYITLDLGEMRGFDYYTGMIFEGFAAGVGKAILSGGRYDNLLARYGYPVAATGFAFDVENIVAALGAGR
ncbi:MAG: ATP phosphoribosyltransferase regulatory subunit [Deltaproteobacteria bacterium]|nr:ATP phosphoribosyltransferase regulatory subunit [Deltaproteobacteria bacterium]